MYTGSKNDASTNDYWLLMIVVKCKFVMALVPSFIANAI